MGKIALRLLFILSLSFNAAFLGQLLFSPEKSKAGDNFLNELRLSKEQGEKIRAASEFIDRENRELTAKIKKCQQNLIQSLQEPQVDKEKAYQCINDINALQQKIQENTIKKILICKEHLTRDQCSGLMDNMCKKMHVNPDYCKKHCDIKK
jgi:Spy/CpxP family protein refolding chaperone